MKRRRLDGDLGGCGGRAILPVPLPLPMNTVPERHDKAEHVQQGYCALISEVAWPPAEVTELSLQVNVLAQQPQTRAVRES